MTNFDFINKDGISAEDFLSELKKTAANSVTGFHSLMSQDDNQKKIDCMKKLSSFLEDKEISSDEIQSMLVARDSGDNTPLDGFLESTELFENCSEDLLRAIFTSQDNGDTLLHKAIVDDQDLFDKLSSLSISDSLKGEMLSLKNRFDSNVVISSIKGEDTDIAIKLLGYVNKDSAISTKLLESIGQNDQSVLHFIYSSDSTSLIKAAHDSLDYISIHAAMLIKDSSGMSCLDYLFDNQNFDQIVDHLGSEGVKSLFLSNGNILSTILTSVDIEEKHISKIIEVLGDNEQFFNAKMTDSNNQDTTVFDFIKNNPNEDKVLLEIRDEYAQTQFSEQCSNLSLEDDMKKAKDALVEILNTFGKFISDKLFREVKSNIDICEQQISTIAEANSKVLLASLESFAKDAAKAIRINEAVNDAKTLVASLEGIDPSDHSNFIRSPTEAKLCKKEGIICPHITQTDSNSESSYYDNIFTFSSSLKDSLIMESLARKEIVDGMEYKELPLDGFTNNKKYSVNNIKKWFADKESQALEAASIHAKEAEKYLNENTPSSKIEEYCGFEGVDVDTNQYKYLCSDGFDYTLAAGQVFEVKDADGV